MAKEAEVSLQDGGEIFRADGHVRELGCAVGEAELEPGEGVLAYGPGRGDEGNGEDEGGGDKESVAPVSSEEWPEDEQGRDEHELAFEHDANAEQCAGEEPAVGGGGEEREEEEGDGP